MSRTELAEAERSLSLLAFDDVAEKADRRKHLKAVLDSRSSWMAYRVLDFAHSIFTKEGLGKLRDQFFEAVIKYAPEDRANKGKDRDAVVKTLQLVKNIPVVFREKLEKLQAEFEEVSA